MSRAVGIMGCGWLGLPLAMSFREEGYVVHGTTTSREKLDTLSGAGIHPFHIQISEAGITGPIGGFLEGTEVLILNIPPGLRSGKGENYVRKMEAVYRAVLQSEVRKLVFVSSTSVYGSIEGEVTEDTRPAPDTESGKQLVQSEQLFVSDSRLQTIVVRFGGLIGPDRHPVTRLSGKQGLDNGQDPVNLIHLDDCIRLIRSVVGDGHWNQIFNGVFPAHPKKADYYTREAAIRQLPPPHYSGKSNQNSSKIVKSRNYLINKYSFFTSIFS